eukprot:GEMP01065637.1.p3 GENE.GEMP01065637.1~~GEMP01065637.1.p3  ORF type:complete len:108 (+),score=20.13 GEMP01065637.1:553-876(+)
MRQDRYCAGGKTASTWENKCAGAARHKFDVPQDVIQIMLIPVENLYAKEFYISIRCKGKADRTPARINVILEKMENWLAERNIGRNGKIRLERYEPSLQHERKLSKL